MLSHRNAVADLLIFQAWLGLEAGKGVGLSGFPFFHIAGVFTNANFIFLGWTQILIPNPRDTDHICKELGRYKPAP
jgi:long-chain acyl-CoA synthetase